MSTLVIVLTAAMAIPGNGPEMVSGEVVRATQPLDLRGDWKGRLWESEDECVKLFFSHTKRGVTAVWDKGRVICTAPFEAVDEGNGKLRATFLFEEGLHGIYRQEGDRLVICLHIEKGKWPTSFQAGKGQNLLILHRVKPRK